MTLRELIRASVDSEYVPDTLLALAEALEATLDTLTASERMALSREAGSDVRELVTRLRQAADPEARREAARLLAALSDNCACSGEAPPEPTFTQMESAAETLARRAIAPVDWLIGAGLL